MKEKYYFAAGRRLNLILIYFSVNLHFCYANSFQNVTEISNVKLHKLATCICEVGKRELHWSPTIVLKIEDNQTGSKSDFIDEITKVFAMGNSPYFSTKSIDNRTFDVNQGNYLFVDYFDNSNTLFDFDFDAIKKKIKYIWVLENYSQKFWNGDFQSIGNRVGKYDVTFLVKATEAEYKMVTFIPAIDTKTCKEAVTTSSVINICVNGYLKRNVSFPSKNPTNLKRCPLKVGMGSLYPFAMIENKASLNTYDRIDADKILGMDVEVIKIIADYSNATLELYYILIFEGNGGKYAHYLPYLLNGSLDACAGGLYRIYGDMVEYSGIYARQSIGWIYTADRPPLTWQNLIRNINGLYIFIIFYLIYSALWFIICLFDERSVSIRDTLLYSWGALVGTASVQDAMSIKQKILNLTFLFMCLHLSVYISINLYSFFTIHGPTEILKTNEDIMNSGRTPYLNKIDKYFNKDDKYVKFANTSLDCTTFLNCTMMSLENKGITVIIDGYFYRFQAETVVNDEARILKPMDNLLTVYYEMIINKECPYVKKFQKVVKILFEAGITVRFYINAIGLTKMDKATITNRNIVLSEYSCQEGCSISIEQISGALYLWAIGCGIASALLVGELLHKRFANPSSIVQKILE